MISSLVAHTLGRSPDLVRGEVEKAMDYAASAGRILVAAGHLDTHPLTLVAADLHCEIRTVSGVAALDLEENLNPIPGAARATTFMIYLPAPAPLEQVVAAAASTHECLSDANPPAPTTETTSASALVDLDALRRAVMMR